MRGREPDYTLKDDFLRVITHLQMLTFVDI